MGNNQTVLTKIVPLDGQVLYENEENTIKIRKQTPIRTLIDSIAKRRRRSLDSSSMSPFDSEIPDFYIEHTELTQNDYFVAQRSWDMILNNEVPLFHKYKRERKIENTNSLNWFYDVFYELLYANIANELYEDVTRLFKKNIKVQSKILAQIIKNSLIVMRNESNEISSNDLFNRMYKAHKQIDLSFKLHVAVAEILIKTFGFCFEKEYENVIFTWQKVMSFIVDKISPYYKNDILEKEMNASENSLDCHNCTNLCKL